MSNATFHAWIERNRPSGFVLDVGSGSHPHGNVTLDICGTPTVRADAAHMPYRHGSFSGVVCAQVLDYTTASVVMILREMHRVLKPGGTLLVTGPRFRALVNDEVLHMFDFVNVRRVKSPWTWPYKAYTCQRSMLPVGRDFCDVTHKHVWVPVHPLLQ